MSVGYYDSSISHELKWIKWSLKQQLKDMDHANYFFYWLSNIKKKKKEKKLELHPYNSNSRNLLLPEVYYSSNNMFLTMFSFVYIYNNKNLFLFQFDFLNIPNKLFICFYLKRLKAQVHPSCCTDIKILLNIYSVSCYS